MTQFNTFCFKFQNQGFRNPVRCSSTSTSMGGHDRDQIQPNLLLRVSFAFHQIRRPMTNNMVASRAKVESVDYGPGFDSRFRLFNSLHRSFLLSFWINYLVHRLFYESFFAVKFSKLTNESFFLHPLRISCSTSEPMAFLYSLSCLWSLVSKCCSTSLMKEEQNWWQQCLFLLWVLVKKLM